MGRRRESGARHTPAPGKGTTPPSSEVKPFIRRRFTWRGPWTLTGAIKLAERKLMNDPKLNFLGEGEKKAPVHQGRKETAIKQIVNDKGNLSLTYADLRDKVMTEVIKRTRTSQSSFKS
ncbi:MAG: hypothetical protein ABID38_00540 [Candidatus Diapherotrites archaeon]